MRKKLIRKIALLIHQDNIAVLPVGSQVLTVHQQPFMIYREGTIYMWVLVDPSEEKTERRIFKMITLGEDLEFDIGHSWAYVGTAFVQNDNREFHVFEYKGV